MSKFRFWISANSLKNYQSRAFTINPFVILIFVASRARLNLSRKKKREKREEKRWVVLHVDVMSVCVCVCVYARACPLYIPGLSFKVSIKLVLPLSGTGSRSPVPSCTSLIAEYMPRIWALHRKFSWPFEKWNDWRCTLISIHWRFSVWSACGEVASLRSHLCCCAWWFVCDSI